VRNHGNGCILAVGLSDRVANGSSVM